jgi:hypothetical protein
MKKDLINGNLLLGYININNDIHFYVTKGEENTTTDVWL